MPAALWVFPLLKNEAGLAGPAADKGDGTDDAAAEDGESADDEDETATAFFRAATCEEGMAEADVR